MKTRLDQWLVEHTPLSSRSQAANLIKLGKVEVNNRLVTKPGQMVGPGDRVKLKAEEQYVSRAGLKLASGAGALKLDFTGKTVLDIGSSTGGFTDYALQHGARKIIAVDVGTDQLHPSLRQNPQIELHEKIDFRDFTTQESLDIMLADLSFISLREILPHAAELAGNKTLIVAMVKPQFEAGSGSKHKGVVKNEKLRRQILKDFEIWATTDAGFIIKDKADSQVTGAKGNRERFYLMHR
jgi:23S rRNA (cytidine1920-2'-O)/16S rRNA (cytidine1409-2'-O)-methyltransferase